MRMEVLLHLFLGSIQGVGDQLHISIVLPQEGNRKLTVRPVADASDLDASEDRKVSCFCRMVE